MKITVIGDMMCEPPILHTSKKEDGSYDFSGVFAKVRPLFEEADYVIGNLEFPLAGEELEYTKTFFQFNGPTEFGIAAKEAGINLVSTTNNHTLDRGYEGMVKTMENLEKIGLPYVGTHLPGREREEAYYFEVEGVKFAVVAHTYATNKKLKPEEVQYQDCINLLAPPTFNRFSPEMKKKMKTWVDPLIKNFKMETRAVIRMCLGLPNVPVRVDDFVDPEAVAPTLEQFISDLKTAKEKADFVVCYPHTGGQFNPEVGGFTEFFVEKALEAGADAVLASHSHMVQKANYQNGVPCVYSLGNFSMSPNSKIIVKKHLPEYGLAVHLYLEGKELKKTTFSILKGVEKKGEQLVSWPVDELYAVSSPAEKKKLEKDLRQVLTYICGEVPEGDLVRREYELKA